MAQLTARLGSLGGTEYADDLCITGEVIDHRAHVGRAPLSHHRHRQGHSSDLELQPVPPVCAQWLGDHVGLIPAPETSPPTRAHRSEARRRAALTDGWDPDVSGCLFENEFF